MTILGVIKAALSLASFLAEIARDKQLMDAGAAKALLEHTNSAMGKIDEALAARRAVRHDVDSVRADPDNRDRR